MTIASMPESTLGLGRSNCGRTWASGQVPGLGREQRSNLGHGSGAMPDKRVTWCQPPNVGHGLLRPVAKGRVNLRD